MNRLTANVPHANAASYNDGNFLPDFGRQAIVRRRALFSFVFLIVVATVAIFTFFQPRSYATLVKLIVTNSSADGSAPNARAAQTPETYAELIQQLPIARQVANDLHLATTPAALLLHVRVEPVPDTPILKLMATWKDPETSARIANGFAAVFVRRERELVTRQADGVITSLEREIPHARARSIAAQSGLSAYQQEANVIDLPTQTTDIVQRQTMLSEKVQQAKLDGQGASASLEVVKAELARTPRTMSGQENIVTNPAVAPLQSQIATLQEQLRSARAHYTDDHPSVSALKVQLAAAQRALRALPPQVSGGTQTIPNPLYLQFAERAAQFQSAVAASQAQLATTRRQEQDGKPAMNRLPETTRRITELQHNAKAAQELYDALQQKYQEANLSRITAISDVTITQPADALSSVKTPNIGLNILLGTVIALALAFAAVVLAEFLDDRLRTEDDIKKRLGLPVLATIPSFDTIDMKDRAWIKPLSVEAFYQLVASLRYSSETPPRTIAFTSPDHGDGKSTVVVNTALSMGLMKARVLVVDADLRRPTIHEKFDISNEQGVTDVLVGLARFADVIKATGHEGVSVMTSGHAAPNPVALLQSDAFDRLLKSATERFDYVVIDGPALRSIVDGVVLGNKTDGTVLVISAKKSQSRVVESALAKLRGVGSTNLLGVVLNGVRSDARDRNDYYLGGGQSIALSAIHGD